MPASPLDDSNGPVRVALSGAGLGEQDAAALISVTVRRTVNQVPSATLVFGDGDLPERRFPLSDSPKFEPGAEITINADYGEDEAPIFSGIVVKHGLAISGSNDARLVVECRDKALSMSAGRRNACYQELTDAEILSALVSAHGLVADVSGADLHHAQLVQHDCTDWDFLVSRAEANACLVIVTDGTVAIAEPQTSGAAVLRVVYGESLIEFEAELGARTVNLQAGAALPKPALDALAKAQQLKSELARLRGRMRFQGTAKARLGALFDVVGVGDRFAGPVLATGLTHRIEQGGWSTEVEFGTPVAWSTEHPHVAAPPAAGRALGIEGLHVGVVLALGVDHAGEHRVQVKLPAAGVDRVWARLMQFSASNAFGAFFVPEVGDEVLLGFVGKDPACPVVLGSLYSSGRPPAQALTPENDVKSIVTRCKARLEFNDEDKVITVSTPGGNTVVLSDKEKSVTLADQSGNKVRLEHAGITLESPKDIKIDAKGAITILAAGALTLGAKADVKLEGLNVSCEAQVGLTAKGSATAELSAGGQTTVKGAMVMIN